LYEENEVLKNKVAELENIVRKARRYTEKEKELNVSLANRAKIPQKKAITTSFIDLTKE